MSNSLNILQVIPYFSPRMGGSAEIVFQLSSWLNKLGHKVTILTSDFHKNESFNVPVEFEIIYLKSFSKWGFYLTPQLFSWFTNNLSGFDIVHSHEFRTYQNIVSSYFASSKKIPFILTAHGTIPNIIEKQFFKNVYDRLFQKKILKNFRAFTAVSQSEVNDYLALGIKRDRVYQIHNGLNIDFYKQTINQLQTTSKKQSVKDRSILFLGRLHKRKNINVLLDAFSILLNNYAGLRLFIAGPNNGELENLQKQAFDLKIVKSVIFPGPVYGQDKIKLYQSASVLAYPSSYEVFGLVAFEALLCGTPVVVSEGAGMGDIIKEAQAGITVPQNDPKALADAIAWLLDNPEFADQQVNKGQQFIRENLDWSKIALNYECLYQQMIDA